MKKQIIIGIDIDDCMCNTLEMDKAYGIYYAQMNNIMLTQEMLDANYYYIPKTFNFTEKQKEDFFMKEKKFIMKQNSMYPKIFVKEVIAKLKKKGFKIFVITGRENKYWNDNCSKYCKKWLKKFDIKYNKLFTDVLNKTDLCQKLKIDLMIEDKSEIVSLLNEKNIKTALIKQEYNKDYKHKDNLLAENWLDLYQKLGKIFKFETNDII